MLDGLTEHLIAMPLTLSQKSQEGICDPFFFFCLFFQSLEEKEVDCHGS